MDSTLQAITASLVRVCRRITRSVQRTHRSTFPTILAQAAISTAERSQQTRLIDINKATLTELRSLPGIGTVKAREIVAGHLTPLWTI
ncbi:MAG: hypothetical protein HC938_13080 [Nitrospira sp.]|nr:hypothetical protein [Nitrospira sp.]